MLEFSSMVARVISLAAMPDWTWAFPQPYKHHCGPATLKTVDNLFDSEEIRFYAVFVDALKPSTKSGTSNKKMIEAAQQFFPEQFISAGEGLYHGGLAIANILHREDNKPHFVVFLGRTEDGEIVYFDPEGKGEFVITPEQEIKWESGEGWKNWSINFKTPEKVSRIIDQLLERAQAEHAA